MSSISPAADESPPRAPFDALLLRLGADGEPAAPVYERLRLRLIAMFRLHLPIEAEALADDSLERLAKRLHEGVTVEHVSAYLHGIARLVLLEARNRPLARRAAAGELDRLRAPEPDEVDDLEAHAALRGCLNKIGEESSRLILAYYADDEAGRIHVRQRLAASLGLNLNALRNRALRLRAALETCVRERLRRDENALGNTEQS